MVVCGQVIAELIYNVYAPPYKLVAKEYVDMM